EEKEQRNKEIIESLNAYEMKLSKVLERLSLSNYQELTSRLETHKKAYDIINNYEATIQETIEEKKLLNKEIDYYQNEISALFELEKDKKKEDYNKKYYEYKKQKQLINQIENYYNQLKTSFDERQLKDLLTINQDEYDLNQKINNYKNEITKIDSEI